MIDTRTLKQLDAIEVLEYDGLPYEAWQEVFYRNKIKYNLSGGIFCLAAHIFDFCLYGDIDDIEKSMEPLCEYCGDTYYFIPPDGEWICYITSLRAVFGFSSQKN